MSAAETLNEYWEVAGPTLAFMLLISVGTMALALERWFALSRARSVLRRCDERVVEAARTGNLDEARRLAEALPTPFRDVFNSGLDRALGRVRGEASTAMSREAKRAAARFRSGLWILGSVGALMPFAGLLGTVVGVMGSFRAIGDSGSGGFAVVSAGISEALIATAAGLFVAIEAVMFFNVLGQKAAGLTRDLNLLVDEMGELFRSLAADG